MTIWVIFIWLFLTVKPHNNFVLFLFSFRYKATGGIVRGGLKPFSYQF